MQTFTAQSPLRCGRRSTIGVSRAPHGWLIAASVSLAVLAAGRSAFAQEAAPADPAAEPVDALVFPYGPPPVDEPPAPTAAKGALIIGLQNSWAAGKYMPALSLGLSGESLALFFEIGFIGRTSGAPSVPSGFLGNQLSFTLSYTPLHLGRWDLGVGVGVDCYALWNLHSQARELALSTRLDAHYWLRDGFGAYANARAYPLATSGLELGTSTSGERGIPVLLTTGIEWRWKS